MKLSELVAQLTAELIKDGDCEVLGRAAGASPITNGGLGLTGIGGINIKALRTDKGLELDVKRAFTEEDRRERERVMMMLEKSRERAEKNKVCPAQQRREIKTEWNY